ADGGHYPVRNLIARGDRIDQIAVELSQKPDRCLSAPTHVSVTSLSNVRHAGARWGPAVSTDVCVLGSDGGNRRRFGSWRSFEIRIASCLVHFVFDWASLGGVGLDSHSSL